MMPRLLAAFLFAALASPALAQVDRETPQTGAQVQLSFAPVVRIAAPAVVNVYATRVEEQRRAFFNDPFFQRFFGESSPFFRSQQRQRGALGSGVIVDPSGIIITNNHVIAEATEIRVSTADGREFPTEIVLSDPDTDLAVLRITETGGRTFPAIQFADSESLEVGDLVLAIGNPFGIGQTVTSGIVSALARSGVGVSDFQFFIQTDAAINPGNSGGALVDMSGRLVGINTEIISRSGGSMGVGFAIPANMVRFVSDAAIANGAIIRPWVGITVQPVTTDIADSLGMDAPQGALVTRVTESSPAQRIGIEVGDVILAFDSHPLESEAAFGYRLATKQIGETAHLTLLRDGEEMALDLPLETEPAPPPDALVVIEGRTRFAGATAATLSPGLIDEFNLPEDARGVLITRVEVGSLADSLGLRPGDVIINVNGEDLSDAATFRDIVLRGANRWNLILMRGNTVMRSSVPG